jgi:hypothetical protein
MAKIIRIPSVDLADFPPDQNKAIDRANSRESRALNPAQTRKKVGLALKSEPTDLASADAVRIDFALRMRSAVDQLSLRVDSLQKTIDVESIDENSSWTNLKAVLIRIQDLLSYHSSNPYLKKLNPRQMDLPIIAISASDNSESKTQIYDDFMKLLGYRKDNTRALVALINKGIEFEMTLKLAKPAGKLGRDPFDPPSE